MPKLAALFFDFDGLILDTESAEVEAWRSTFHCFGVEFPDLWWLDVIGRGADLIVEQPEDLLERLLGRSVDREEVRRVTDEKRLGAIHAADPREGIVTLMEVAQQAGVPMSVVSSSRHPWVDGHLSRLDLAKYFVRTVCAEDVPRAKPYPDLYLEAIRLQGVASSSVVALEDSPNGVRAAVDAGLRCLAIPNPVTARMDLSHAHAHVSSAQDVTLEYLQWMLD